MKIKIILTIITLIPGLLLNAVNLQRFYKVSVSLVKPNIHCSLQIDGLITSVNYGNVTVSGNSIINGTLNLKSTVTATGSYISYGTTTGTGTTNAERYMTGGAGNFWHMYSAPVSGQNIQNFFVDVPNSIPFKNSTTYGSEYYDEMNGAWVYFTTTNLPDADTSTFLKGKAYLLRRTGDGIITSSGLLNSGNISPIITRNGFGWNAVGNPYSSSIGLNTGSTSTNFLGANSSNLDNSYMAVYFWNGTSYIPINNSSPATYIQPGQGFHIKSKLGGGDINFSSALQAHNNPAFYKKSSSGLWDEIILEIHSASDTAKTKILFRDDMTRGLDISYDAGIFRGNQKILLYTKLVEDNGVDFGIQCLSSQETDPMSIPLGLEIITGGLMTFNANISSLPAGYRAILEDRLLGIFTDLELPENKYVQVLESGTSGTGRFYLHVSEELFKTVTIKEKITTYSFKKEIYIKGDVSQGSIAAIYDLMGRKIVDFILESSDMNVLNVDELKEGIYIVKVVDKGVLTADRVFITE